MVRKKRKRVEDEGHDVWDIWVLTFDHLPKLYDLGRAGDGRAMKVHDLALQGFVHVLRKSTQPKPALCLLCDHAFAAPNPPAAVVVLVGHVDSPKGGVCSGLCDRCFGVAGDELMRRIVAYYRDTFMGDVRIIRPINTPGYA